MAYIGTSPSNGVRRKHTYTATSGQTSFSGAGAEGATLSYSDSNFVDVYQNGVKLAEEDYTATSGTAIVLAQGASADDIVEIIAFDVFSVADTVSKSAGGTFDGNITAGGTLGVTGAITSSAGATITTADNTAQLTLKSTDADSSTGPVLDLTRDSASPADGDSVGEIVFKADDDGGNSTEFASIQTKISDASDGTEDGKIEISTIVAGTSRKMINIKSDEVVINDDSIDLDFRVESDNFTYALFVNGADGVVQLGNTDDDPVFNNSVGCSFNSNNGSSVRGVGQFSCSGAVAGRFNRTNEDGAIIGIHSAGTQEGTISTSGNTVSYNAFSGSHWSRLTDNSKPTILKGTIIETIDEMCDWYQAEFTVDLTTKKVSIALPSGKSVGDTITQTYRGTDYSATIIKEKDNKHTKCKISDTADSKRVYGVFAAFDNDDDTVNDMYVTAVGTHVVRINKDITVSAGDLLASNGDGTAKVQDDDIIRSKTIGKVLTNIKQETYSDDSYTVPCALYSG